MLPNFRGRGIAGALIAIGLSFAAVTAYAQTAQYQAGLTGGGVVPAVTSDATGTFAMTVEGITSTYTLTVESIEAATAAHIHVGAAGENGGVVAILFAPSDPASSIAASGTIALVGDLADDMAGFGAALTDGRLYVQVHTAGNPAGELRGQILAQISVADTGNAGIASARPGGSAPLAALVVLFAIALVLGGRRLTARARGVGDI